MMAPGCGPFHLKKSHKPLTDGVWFIGLTCLYTSFVSFFSSQTETHRRKTPPPHAWNRVFGTPNRLLQNPLPGGLSGAKGAPLRFTGPRSKDRQGHKDQQVNT